MRYPEDLPQGNDKTVSKGRSMRVLITGADRPHCRLLVKKLVLAGHDVLASGIDSTQLDALASQFGSKVHPLHIIEPTRHVAVREALTLLPEAWGSIDVLINDATLALGTSLALDASLDDWDAMIDANCGALVAMTEAVLVGMVARHAGTILNLSAALELSPVKGDSVFGATVAFVHQYTLGLIERTVGTNVRVSCIAPDRHGKAELLDLANKYDLRSTAPQKREFIATDVDIIETIFWIATLPAHINLNYLELAQTGELFSPRTIMQDGK